MVEPEMVSDVPLYRHERRQAQMLSSKMAREARLNLSRFGTIDEESSSCDDQSFITAFN